MMMRRLHRWLSIIAAAFILFVSVSGMIMAIDSIWTTSYMASHGLSAPGPGGTPPAGLLTMFADDGIVADGELKPMLDTTLNAVHSGNASALPVRVIRLRTYGGMPQGVVISGDAVAEQQVFNARTGSVARLYEPGYPKTPMPLQWHVHETWKRLHRGDFFGLTGRWMDLLTGLSILFLSLSGIFMYLQLRAVRVGRGRREVFWK
jgi:PepSY-associated TM region